jgi:hypothetical protein
LLQEVWFYHCYYTGWRCTPSQGTWFNRGLAWLGGTNLIC